MADHDTVSWPSTKITLSDGSTQNITEGTTTDDVSGGLVANKPYYIYWKQSDPTVFHTVLAKNWVSENVGGYTLVATVTGAASGGSVQIKYTGSLAVDGQDQINASEIVNQDSVTGTEISTVGSTATSGLRIKMSTAGAGDAGSGSAGAYLRAYTGNSVSDTSGRWLDIDGDEQAVYFRDGSQANYILASLDGTGLKFYSGTDDDATAATTRAHYGGSEMTFYNASGSGAGNELLQLGVGATNGLTLFGSTASTTSSPSLIKYNARIGSNWVTHGYHGLYNDGSVDHLITYTPLSKVWMISGNTGGSATIGSTIHFETGEGLAAGWKMHASSDSEGTPIFRNYFFPVNSGSGSSIAGDLTPDGTSDEPYNYIGYMPGDTRDGQGAMTTSPTITIVHSKWFSGFDGSASYPTFYFDQDTGVYSDADNSVAFSAGGTKRAHWNSSGTTLDTLTVAGGTTIVHNGGLLTAASSSIRYKEAVIDLETDTTDIYNLRPVAFNWKSNKQSDFGLIAEEVDEILPMLVHYDKDVPESVAYDKLSVLLLMEVKKLREEIKELKEKN